MQAYAVIVGLYLVAAALLLSVFGLQLRTWVDVGILLVGVVPEVIRRSPTLYLFAVRSRLFLLNTSLTWELAARFDTPAGPLDPRTVADGLIRWAGDGSVLTSSPDRLLLRFNRRFIVELAVPNVVSAGLPDGLEVSDNLHVSVQPVNVGYRDSRRFIDDELLPAIEKLRELARADASTYSLRIELPTNNPYTGLYLRSFPAGAVQDIRIQFRPVPRRDAEVLVNTKYMSVAATTIESFRMAVAAALAFAGSKARHAS